MQQVGEKKYDEASGETFSNVEQQRFSLWHCEDRKVHRKKNLFFKGQKQLFNHKAIAPTACDIPELNNINSLWKETQILQLIILIKQRILN
jgi:hypothetical protein